VAATLYCCSEQGETEHTEKEGKKNINKAKECSRQYQLVTEYLYFVATWLSLLLIRRTI
jgi:hypothetical protein